MRVAGMLIMRWMSDKTFKDRIPNNIIRAQLEVTPIEEKIQENRIHWFGHIQRRFSDVILKRYIPYNFVGIFRIDVVGLKEHG